MPLSSSTTSSPSISAVSAGSAATAAAMARSAASNPALARQQPHLAAIEPRLDAITVEFDFVHPFCPRGASLCSVARLGCTKSGGRFCAARELVFSAHWLGPRLWRAPAVLFFRRLAPTRSPCTFCLRTAPFPWFAGFFVAYCCARPAFYLCLRQSPPSNGRSRPTAAPRRKCPCRSARALPRPCS